MVRPGNSTKLSALILCICILSATALACGRDQKSAGGGPSSSSSAQSISSTPLVLAPSSEGPMSAPIPGAEAVVAALRPHFKLCYRAGLVHDPSIEGSVVMDAVVSPDGAVTSVKQHLPTTLPPVVVGCLEDALKTAKFTPPGGTGSSIRVPVNFHHAGDGGS